VELLAQASQGAWLTGVRLIISDACLGLAESAAKFFPYAAWQVCGSSIPRHLQPRALDQGAGDRGELRAIHASEDIVAPREKAILVIEKLLGLRLTRATELAEAGVEESLSYYAFPEEHWRRIRTNNPLERLLREIRRRTCVVGAFPAPPYLAFQL
jgi:transposase-like protein